MATTIDDLPTEMLVELFRYLPESDLQQCYFVCKEWQEIVVSYNLASIDLCLSHKNLNDDDLVENLKRTRLKVKTLHLKEEYSAGLNQRLLTELGKTVKELTIEAIPYDAPDEYLTDILHYLTGLNELHCMMCPRIVYSDETPQFESITKFIISIHVWIDFSHVERLVRLMPNLRHFGIRSGGITAHNDIIKTVRRQIDSLRCLDLENCRTNNSTLLLEKLTSLANLKLEELTINIGFVAENVVLDFFASQKEIKTLKLSSTTEIPIELIQKVIKTLPYLTNISIDVTEIVLNVDQYLTNILEITQLKAVRFEQKFIYESRSHPPFSFHKLPKSNLTHFHLRYFPSCTIPSMHEFCKSMKMLTTLSLKAAQISNVELSIVFQHFRHLQVLDLSYCKRISDAGFIGVNRNELKRTKIGDYSLKDLKALKSLNLLWCSKVTLKPFEEDLGLLDLREIGLTQIPSDLDSLENPNFRRLEIIKVSSKSLRIGDDFLREIKARLPRLNEIKEIYD